MLSSVCFAQTVSNVRFEQVNNKVKITYSLDKQADISVCVSEDGGKTWSSPLKQVSGDVGRDVQAGAKTIWWDVLAEEKQLVGTDICFKVMPQNSANLTFTVKRQTFTMIYVEGGTFTMGTTSQYGIDVRDAHCITLSDYYIGQYEVTQGLWQAVMENNPANFKQGNLYPVERVSWEDCQLFISKLNTLLAVQLGGKRFALPTEAQWEYAARGGKKTQNYKYAGGNDLSNVAWYAGNANYTTHAVGQKAPNELGLYDMSGNVWEWCLDWYGGHSIVAQATPYSSDDKVARVERGGSYNYYSGACSILFRSGHIPSFRMDELGLRLVLVP